ncbi:hypothetical protein [Nocardia otitidiscaviarum]|uniref:hypothetical protein n=1 Tax=Nocardia otitidiscaviarum TaxID=1823 RepID=UPI002457BAE9|nr:hypothetical protein [Nocardia otitidiscaviarum]
MTARRTLTALSVLPVVLAAGHGVAGAAPGQPGLAVPGEGQPGLTQPPQAPATPPTPSPADWIPDPPPPPARPRPQQQVQPNIDTLVQPPSQREQPSEPEAEPAQPAPETPYIPENPHQLRLGTGIVDLPEWVDVRTRDKAQAYADWAEWQIAAAYDGMGFSREESDRMAATSSMGALLGAGTAGALAPAVLVPIGCGVGAAVGALAGAAIGGIPTAGVGAPAGAIVGGIAGCVGGGSLGGMVSVPLVVGGGALAALAGGALSGGDSTKPQPPLPIDQPVATQVAAPAPAPLIHIPGVLTVAAPVIPGVTPAAAPAAAPGVQPAPAPLIDIPGVATIAAPVIPGITPAPAPAPIAEPAPAPIAEPAPVWEPAPVAAPQYAEPVAQVTAQVVDTAAAVEESGPVGAAVVGGLRDAVAAMPPLAPELGPAADVINGVVSAFHAPR